MLKEGEIILYHGTSTKDIETVLEKGYPAVQGNSKYDEVIAVMSKYIRSEILTPDFFEYYKEVIPRLFHLVGNPIYRIGQLSEGCRGIFAVWSEYMIEGKHYTHSYDTSFEDAAAYAQAAATYQVGEFEDYFWKNLNALRSIRCTTEEGKELVTLITQNIQPKYRTEDGYQIYLEKSDKPLFPIVVEIKTSYDNFVHRVVGDILPEEIIGISFADKNDKQNFLSKEDFLKEYHARLRQPQKICSHGDSQKDNQNTLV